MTDILRAVDKVYPGFLSLALDVATEQKVYKTILALANIPAPSQTASLTRGHVIEELLTERRLLNDGTVYIKNAFDSGCDVLEKSTGGIRFVAHMDEISYVIAGEPRGDSWPLIPFCYHLANGPRRARVIRYTASVGYHVLGKGEVRDEGGLRFFSEDDSTLEPGDRVVLNYPIEVDEANNRITGHIDNAAGVTCALVAAEILCKAGVPFSVVFTDEEEGPAGQSSQTISRGAARIYPHLAPAPIDVVIDVHTLNRKELRRSEFHKRRWGASLAEFSSHTRGSVTPPHVYGTLREVARALNSHDVMVRQNVGGYVSRSDDVIAMMHSSRVAILGYPGINRHFDDGLAATNLTDLRDLTIALAVLGATVSAAEQEG
jgi:putative aminopeptidase FrvX